MEETTSPQMDTESRKMRIRERYKGVDLEELDVIPALPQESLYDGTNEKRVAVYARVSTDDPRQTSSYELQKNHYQDVVTRHPGWNLINIYADEGISGTSLQHRDAFIQMIKDCQDGKIDLIVTKSVARFARNILDCIGYVRQLANMQPPVGVFFETENIYTLNNNSEMLLSFIATMAQEESHTKSEIMNSSIEMRFRRGIFLTPPLLGYDRDADGNLIINEEEAETVRLIFFMYLYGNTCTEIAETMTKLGRRTKKNNTYWSAPSILQILQNERHCGDVLARKTWTPNYLNHKPKKNRLDRNQYRKRNHHEAIISRDDFIAVQHLISNARYGNKGILPELQVIHDGTLKGFVTVNPRWAAFTADDYRAASGSVSDEGEELSENVLKVEVQSGDFDLRGFEIARSQFFDTAHKICITLSENKVVFSTECVRKFNKATYIEILVHPGENLLVVRPCTKEARNSIQWAKLSEGQCHTRNINSSAYIKMLYELYGWRSDCRYRVRGVYRHKNNEAILIFDMKETEIFIPQDSLDLAQVKATDTDLIPNNLQPFNLIIRQLPKFVQVGLNIIQALLKAILGNLPMIINSALLITNTLTKGLIDSLPQITAGAVQLLLGLVNGLISHLPEILKAALTVVLTLANGIAAALPVLIPKIVETVVFMVTTLLDNIDLLIDAALQLIMGLAQGLIIALPQLIDKIPVMIAYPASCCIHSASLLSESGCINQLFCGLHTMRQKYDAPSDQNGHREG